MTAGREFEGKVAFITGAAHGQGRAVALNLASHGARIAADKGRLTTRFGRLADTSSGSEAARIRIWRSVDRLLAAEPARPTGRAARG